MGILPSRLESPRVANCSIYGVVSATSTTPGKVLFNAWIDQPSSTIGAVITPGREEIIARELTRTTSLRNTHGILLDQLSRI